jgi:hypothetical protein
VQGAGHKATKGLPRTEKDEPTRRGTRCRGAGTLEGGEGEGGGQALRRSSGARPGAVGLGQPKEGLELEH